ncbi:DUF6036 family nucleotidyltransferase [Desulfococcaceae bacterium HSG8]|nr:DUF6036 family nucleotidyltransferase [Desulfococcaceae bacterium HSG8]
MEKALNRLNELLHERNETIELVVVGGAISVLFFENRYSTKDVDAVYPVGKEKLMEEIIKTVSAEQNLPDDWMNSGVEFFGVQTKSRNVIFKQENLILYAAEWEEMLGMKLSGAFRGNKDIDDAMEILKQIGNKNRSETLIKVVKYKNFTPEIPDDTIRKRFDLIWHKVFD